ncbi:MAG: hypothetical protein JSV76_03615 [Candidatus Bathyarchaeota archaeon]|nr:MAG: hypothetical protein JSV76_03615 [Candidatus Bathyarchaeota archaeon]
MMDALPPEPNHIKRALETLIDRMNDEPGDWQALAVWYGNKLPQYLWTEQNWKTDLTKFGWRWQSFLRVLSKHTPSIIRWVTNELSWSELLGELIADLGYLQGRNHTTLEEFFS